MRNFLLLFPLFLLATSCQNKKAGEKEAAAATVYCDYRIWGEEGREEATLRLQYKMGGDEGEAVAWRPPAKVLFDGAEIKADSSRFTGPYYELVKPVGELSGRHSVVFVDLNGKTHRDSFRFEPFSLAEEMPDRIGKKAFQLQLANFPDTPSLVRLVMADTSLNSDGVNEEMRIEKGIVNITEQTLMKLTNGPVILEIYREEEKPVGGRRGISGTLSVAYSLKREFELTD